MLQQIQPYPNIYNRAFYAKKSDKTEVQVSSHSDNTIVETKKNDKMGVNWKSGVGLIVLAAIGSALLFSRGIQKNFSKYLNKAKEFLENKLELSYVNGSDNKTKFYEYSIRKINSFLHKFESINNITSVKDILFMKLMYETEPTKRIHNAISNYFEKLSRKTVTNSYKKTEKSFNRTFSIFDELDKLILTKSPDEIIEYEAEKYTKRELVEKAKQHRDTAQLVIDTFICKEAQQNRYQYMNDVTSTLYSRFWDASFKDFWTKNNKFKRKEMWQTFIAAEQIKGNKTELVKNINYTKEIISYSDEYKKDLINQNIKELSLTIPINDNEGAEIVEKLEYIVRNPQNITENKELLLKELDKLEHHRISKDIDSQISNVQESYKKTCIDIIKNQIKEDSTGEFQRMLSIYNKIAPYELVKTGASNALIRSVDSFDESVRLEVVELFDKIRDLKLGSAPTDVLTILVSFIMISFGLGHAKNTDERNSIMLKSGIPIAGAITTALISATKLVAGGKSILLGLISGLLLNKTGSISDKILKSNRLETKNPV